MSTNPQQPIPPFNIQFSRMLPTWLAEVGASIACTTYQAGKVFMFGLGAQGVSTVERTFPRCMGLAVGNDRLYLASLYQLWRFNNLLEAGEKYQDYDRVYVPQVGWTTGDVDIHDIGIDASGQPVFINTLFSCLARASNDHSFEAIWSPPFISKLAPEDRCHLNGLAMQNNQPAWASMISRSYIAEGWRDQRHNGGLVMDVRSNEVVCDGLSMPHSPRWHQGELWLLNSGTGELGRIDVERGCFEPVCFVPGYTRGLSFIDHYALVGLSNARNASFSGLPLDEQLRQRSAQPRCGIAIIDTRSGNIVHNVRFEGIIDELYDVAVLANTQRPYFLGFKTDEIRLMIKPGPRNRPTAS